MSFKQIVSFAVLLIYGNCMALAADTAVNNQQALSEAVHRDNNQSAKPNDQASPPAPVTLANPATSVTPVTPAKAEPVLVTDTAPETDSIQDPTQMTGSFTQALGQMQLKASKGSGNAGGGKNEPMFPVIELVSKKISARSERLVLLAVDGKRYQAKVGGQFSCLWNNTWLEIEINTITKDEVVLTLNPMKKKITLY